MRVLNNQTCVRCINDKTVRHISFDSEGVCNFCREYEKYAGKLHDYEALEKNFLNRISNRAGDGCAKHRYDAAVGFSGGKDSAFVLYQLVKVYGLKVKAFTLDNGFMSPEAKDKIRSMVSKLGVEHEFVALDQTLVKEMYRQIAGKFLSPCMCCAFIGYAVMINYASKVDAAVMIHGRSPYQMLRNFSNLDNDYFKPFVTEGLEEVAQDPAELLQVILSKIDMFVDKNLAASIREKFLGDCFEKGFRPFVAYFLYHKYDKAEILEFLKQNMGWVAESEEEHFDCLIHHGALYIKNIIARRSHLMPELSVMIREGKISREQALEMALESEQIDEGVAREELEKFGKFAGLNAKWMLTKAKIYGKRWW